MAKITVRLPAFGGVGLYRIGNLLFDGGIAETDELSHSDREVIEMLGAEVEGDEEAPAAPSAPETSDEQAPLEAPEEEQVPAGSTPPEPDASDDAEVGDGEVEDAPAPEAEPETSGSSFVDPTPTTPEQAAAAPFETATVASDTDGSVVMTAGSGEAPASTEAE